MKITVIATGFRDQMPERRARMLSVEESAGLLCACGCSRYVAARERRSTSATRCSTPHRAL